MSVFTEQNQVNILPVFVRHDLITFISCPLLNYFLIIGSKAYMRHFLREVLDEKLSCGSLIGFALFEK